MTSRFKGKVTERGQVTIPKPLRERLGIQPGETLEFDEGDEGRLVARKASARDPVDAVYGVLELGHSTDELIGRLRGAADAV